MKISLTDIKLIENYLSDNLSVEEKLVADARLLSDPFFRFNFKAQKKLYELLRFYHRKKLSDRITRTHHRLFTDPAKREFRKSILQIFNH